MRKSFSSIIYGIHLPIEALNLCFEEHRTKVFEMYPNVLTFHWGKYRLKIPENMARMVTFIVEWRRKGKLLSLRYSLDLGLLHHIARAVRFVFFVTRNLDCLFFFYCNFCPALSCFR